MPEGLDRQQLISLVEKIMRGEGSEEEIAMWRTLIDRSVPCPDGYVFDLIFYPHSNGLEGNPTAQEMVDRALSYKPIQL